MVSKEDVLYLDSRRMRQRSNGAVEIAIPKHIIKILRDNGLTEFLNRKVKLELVNDNGNLCIMIDPDCAVKDAKR